VKHLSADDSAHSRVKVGHRQALTPPQAPSTLQLQGARLLVVSKMPSVRRRPSSFVFAK
jgi:hypothetical protein